MGVAPKIYDTSRPDMHVCDPKGGSLQQYQGGSLHKGSSLKQYSDDLSLPDAIKKHDDNFPDPNGGELK